MVGGIDRGAHPFEVTHHVAGDSRMNVGTLVKKRGPRHAGHNRLRKVVGWARAQGLINVGEMFAVEFVEFAIVG